MMQFSPEAAPTKPATRRRARGLAVRLGGALTCAALVTGAWAQEEKPAAAPATAVGLKGLLPAEAPEGLMNTLATLPETWAQWTEGVTTDLTKFYGETAADLAGQEAAIESLKARLETLDKSLADSQYDSIRPQLSGLRTSLNRRIEVIEAVLDTLTADPTTGRGAAIEAAKAQVTAGIETADSYLDTIKGGDAWKKFLSTSEVRAAVAGEADPVKLVATLTPILETTRKATKSEDAAIRDFIANGALKTYLRDLEHAVAVLNRATSGVNQEEVRKHLKDLLEGLENYEATGTNDAAAEVRGAYDALRIVTADGGERLTTVLRQHYFNSNLQLAISEGFLNRVLTKTHIEEGGVRDFILGAEVYGCQITSTVAKFDLLPAENGTLFRINLTGTVSTNTEGYKGHIVIYSNGNHNFTAFKDVRFDGEHFSTTPANMHVNASNEPVDASTPADNFPVLGGVAKSIAMNGALRKRQEAEAIAAQRVTSRVGPEFDNEVDNKFTELNGKLQSKLVDPLKTENLYPDYKTYRSTDTELDLKSRLMAEKELGGGIAPVETVQDGEMLVRLHESLINNFLDRLAIGGKTMTEQDLRKLLEEKFSKLLNKEVSLPAAKEATGDEAAKQPKAFIFTDKDPLRVKVANGQVSLIIRAGFQRDEDKGGNIPPQIVTIPLSITIEGEEVVITRGEVLVDPVAPPENVAEQLARAGVIKNKIETSIQNKRDTRTMKVDKLEGEPIDVNVTEVEALDGWLSIRLK
ncbi:MAG: hypothetical protein V4719_21025 [Planctomycetota bacterium]